MNHPLLTLASGSLVLDLVPSLGGAVANFTHDSTPLFRPPPAEGLVAARSLGCYPLVPFSNRIKEGRFRYGGVRYQAGPISPVDPLHAIHGDGFRHPWQVVASGPKAATLVYQHDGAEGWPFSYRAIQHFDLSDTGLTVRMTLTNEDIRAFPAGFGLHPFFPKAGATLTTYAPTFWKSDETRIPMLEMPVPPAWDFAGGRVMAEIEVDNCFAGWSGRAIVRWREKRLSLTMTADPVFGHLVVFVPPGRTYFCVEPVSNCNDGMNLLAKGRTDTGVVELPPGGKLSGRILLAFSRVDGGAR